MNTDKFIIALSGTSNSNESAQMEILTERIKNDLLNK